MCKISDIVVDTFFLEHKKIILNHKPNSTHFKNIKKVLEEVIKVYEKEKIK